MAKRVSGPHHSYIFLGQHMNIRETFAPPAFRFQHMRLARSVVLNLLWFVGPLLKTFNTCGPRLRNKILCLYFIRSGYRYAVLFQPIQFFRREAINIKKKKQTNKQTKPIQFFRREAINIKKKKQTNKQTKPIQFFRREAINIKKKKQTNKQTKPIQFSRREASNIKKKKQTNKRKSKKCQRIKHDNQIYYAISVKFVFVLV